jgi:hypothetical protein
MKTFEEFLDALKRVTATVGLRWTIEDGRLIRAYFDINEGLECCPGTAVLPGGPYRMTDTTGLVLAGLDEDLAIRIVCAADGRALGFGLAPPPTFAADRAALLAALDLKEPR